MLADDPERVDAFQPRLTERAVGARPAKRLVDRSVGGVGLGVDHLDGDARLEPRCSFCTVSALECREPITLAHVGP